MHALVLLRFVKFCGVSALMGGALALLVCRDWGDRRRLVFRLIGPGFGVTWTAGFLLVNQLSVSLLEAWVLGSMALSMLSLLIALFSISKPERDTTLANILILLPLGLALFFMIWRPELGCLATKTA